MHVISATCFNEFFFVITGRHCSFIDFIVTLRFFHHHLVTFLQTSILKRSFFYNISTITVQWLYQISKIKLSYTMLNKISTLLYFLTTCFIYTLLFCNYSIFLFLAQYLKKKLKYSLGTCFHNLSLES